MLNHLFRLHKNSSVDFVLKVMVSIVLLCFIGPLRLEMKGQLPITLQSFIVLLVAISFGWRIGIISMLAYLIIGASGIPVFAGYSAGYHHIIAQFGGFFFGMLMATLVCGYIAEKHKAHKPLWLVLNWTLGHCIILLMGSVWLSRFNDQWWTMIVEVLPGAATKTAFGFLISTLIYRSRVSREEFYEKL